MGKMSSTSKSSNRKSNKYYTKGKGNYYKGKGNSIPTKGKGKGGFPNFPSFPRPPYGAPVTEPSEQPTALPSLSTAPSTKPSTAPSVSNQPTATPSGQPTDIQNSAAPSSEAVTESNSPTTAKSVALSHTPTSVPSLATMSPTQMEAYFSKIPSQAPSLEQGSFKPTETITVENTTSPTAIQNSTAPYIAPTVSNNTQVPTVYNASGSEAPTALLSDKPSQAPSLIITTSNQSTAINDTNNSSPIPTTNQIDRITQSPTDNPTSLTPDNGNDFPIVPLVIILTISGLMCCAGIGIIARRRRRQEEEDTNQTNIASTGDEETVRPAGYTTSFNSQNSYDDLMTIPLDNSLSTVPEETSSQITH